jgi:BirA family biotin operon repressor/biotin-[acetyl-CoA-carboxylase] ligase
LGAHRSVYMSGMKEADSTSGCTVKSVSGRLKTKKLGRALLFLDECPSTNDVGREYAIEGAPHGLLIVSESQSAGRGRHGRDWISPRGGIWMTLILRPPAITLTPEELPLIGALAVARSIHLELSIDAKVRWPNDVVVDGSKVAGVIAESQQEGNSVEFVLLGIGVNANFESHKILEKVHATTLMDTRGSPIDCSALICKILLEVEDLLGHAASDRVQLLELLRKHDYSGGRRIRIALEKQTIEGIFVDYESIGEVKIATNGQSFTVNTASVLSAEYLT